MKLVSFVVASVAGAMFALPAFALTISNSDPDPHTITVTAGTDTKEVTIAPDQQVEPVCAEGCVVELDNGEQYQMTGNEQVSIEDGVIFVDSAPGNGDAEDFPDTNDSGDDNSAAAPAGSDTTGAAPPSDAAAPAGTAASADKPAQGQ